MAHFAAIEGELYGEAPLEVTKVQKIFGFESSCLGRWTSVKSQLWTCADLSKVLRYELCLMWVIQYCIVIAPRVPKVFTIQATFK